MHPNHHRICNDFADAIIKTSSRGTSPGFQARVSDAAITLLLSLSLPFAQKPRDCRASICAVGASLRSQQRLQYALVIEQIGRITHSAGAEFPITALYLFHALHEMSGV